MASPPRSYRMALRWLTCRASDRVSRRVPSWREAASQSSSTAFMALRTSPPQAWAIYSGTPSSHSMGRGLSERTRSRARATAGSTSAAVTGLNSKTVLRLRRAA